MISFSPSKLRKKSLDEFFDAYLLWFFFQTAQTKENLCKKIVETSDELVRRNIIKIRCETDAFLFFHSSTPSGLWGFQEIQNKKGKPISKKLETSELMSNTYLLRARVKVFKEVSEVWSNP